MGLFFYAWMVQTPWNDDFCFPAGTGFSLCTFCRQSHRQKQKHKKPISSDTITHVSQVESENKRRRSRHAPKGNMRPRHAPKGQRAHSPGQRPGYDEAMKCALKGQKHKRASVYRDAFALSGRNSGGLPTQGAALGYVLVGPSARSLNACQLQVNTCET